jgi:endonuclease/exonuclease/phosphatase family metal-dependent hydrolase
MTEREQTLKVETSIDYIVPNEIGAMTFNVRGSFEEEDPIHNWSNRKDLALQMILTSNPDFMVWNEGQFGNLDTYQTNLRKIYSIELGANMDNGNFNPIFWKDNVMKWDQSGHLWLHPDGTPNVVAEEWGAGGIRSLTWGVFRHIQTGKLIAVFGGHFDNISKRARIEAAKMALRKRLEIGKHIPAVFMGDVNEGEYIPLEGRGKASYSNDALQILKEAGFVDPFPLFNVEGAPGTNSFDNFEGPFYNPANSHWFWRVDHVLIDGLIPISSSVIERYDQFPRVPSDHKPVEGRFGL